jgi:hypothetical protein
MNKLTVFLLVFIISTATGLDRLSPNNCLNQEDRLTSKNSCFFLLMQTDGNLVLYKKSTGQALWNSGTHRTCTNKVCMQGDGNLVTYDRHNIATWNANTQNHEGSSLLLQDDGNLVVYTWNDARAIWNSGTVTNC